MPWGGGFKTPQKGERRLTEQGTCDFLGHLLNWECTPCLEAKPKLQPNGPAEVQCDIFCPMSFKKMFSKVFSKVANRWQGSSANHALRAHPLDKFLALEKVAFLVWSIFRFLLKKSQAATPTRA